MAKKTVHKVIFDSSADMGEVDDESVKCIVTSPPYNVGLEYEKKRQSNEEYVDSLHPTWEECHRVLNRKDGVFFLIIDARFDQIFSAHEVAYDIVKTGFEVSQQPLIWNIINAKDVHGLLPKFLLHQYEFIFLFAKSRKTYSLNWESTLGYHNDMWNVPFTPADLRYAGDDGHPALFPLEIPTRCIRLACHQRDIVLDPFLGSGTTTQAAMRLGCNSFGYERELRYKRVIERRNSSQLGLSRKHNFKLEFIEREVKTLGGVKRKPSAKQHFT